MEELFQTAAALVRENSGDDGPPASNDEKLRLYGLYKHVVDGPCPGDALPPMYQAVARTKYQAWEACRTYDNQEAMEEYVKLLASRNDRLGCRCQELLDELLEQQKKGTSANENMKPKSKASEEKKSLPRTETLGTFKSVEPRPTTKNETGVLAIESLILLIYSWMTYLLGLIGVRPLIPRGRLDISFRDLLFALFQCLHWRGTRRRCFQLDGRIRNLWKQATGYEVAVGFSVRSLLDLYLCTKQYPDQSEVVVFPPINVPGMMHVAQYHNLKLVPVDIGESEWWNWKGMEEAINKKTVAIMIVHPFGMVTTSEQQMKQIHDLANTRSIELWEDCAECFTGLGENCYLGSTVADVRFFSFGIIKTATALGGGVAIFRKAEIARQIQRLQQSLCKRQSTAEYFRRICLSLVLNFIAASPLLFGLLVSAYSMFGLNYDKIVTGAVRGFQMSSIQNPEAFDGQIRGRMRGQIRQQPSPALLALLLRRFQQSIVLTPSFSQKLNRCQHLDSMLREQLPEIMLPNPPNVLNTYWAFPIFCKDRAFVSRQLQLRGFDVVSWASQLRCIATPEASSTEVHPCPRTQRLMSSILYLPISSQNLSTSSTRNLVAALRQVGTVSKSSTLERMDNRSDQFGNVTWRAVLGIFVAWLAVVWKSTRWAILPMLARFVVRAMWSISAVACIVAVSQHVLRLLIAPLYLHHSHWFMHFDMIDAATVDKSLGSKTSKKSSESILSQIGSLRLTNVDVKAESATDRKALLTGATGFVGSLLLRDLLLHRKELSITHGIIVLCRGKGKRSAESRIASLLSKPMFEFLSDDEKSQLVDVVEGDVTKLSAGLSENDFSRIIQDETISHVFHCAAAVSFTQDLTEAARSNISSTLGMQALTYQLKNKDVQFIHISTAFVHGDRTGSFSSPLKEELFSLGPYDPMEIYKSMLGTQFYATKAMSQLGFPNTYTFSKCVCEHLLLQENDAKTLIIRPSIVGPAVESPFEGWAGEKPSTLVAASMLYLSLPWNIWHLPPHGVSYVPVDVLSRFILAKAYSVTPGNLEVNFQGSSSCSSSFHEVSRTNMSESSSDSGELISVTSSNIKGFQRIFNATWDSASNDNATFTWLDFGVAQCHLAVITGYVTRPIAFCALFVAARFMPSLAPSAPFYQQLHSFFIRNPISFLVTILNRIRRPHGRLSKLLPFLDLPLLFFPFVKAKFYFRSDLVAADSFDAKRYAFSCGVAAHRFLSSLRSREFNKTSKTNTEKQNECTPRLSTLPIGGKIHKTQPSDFLWALSQPRGSYFIRLAAFIFKKVLRAVTDVVTVDLVSFRDIFSMIPTVEDETTYIILAPTHRSFFDFLLLSYVFFALPELQLDIPFIIAADEFEQLPIIGIIAQMLRAFYIRRGRGYEDKDLATKLASLKSKKLTESGGCLEVFLEGKRSRDRRFAYPKTGLLKSLKESGGHHIIVPIAINYEAIPEQKQLSAEASGTTRGALNIVGMLRWLRDAIRGKIDIGKVHIAAGEALSMACQQTEDFMDLACQVQVAQQDLIYVSDYHIHAASRLFKMDFDDAKKAMGKLGCNFWPDVKQRHFPSNVPKLPNDESDLCSIVFQFSHQLAPLFYLERRKWSLWLNHVNANTKSSAKPNQYTQAIYESLLNYFDAADQLVDDALKQLREHGFNHPKQIHLFQASTKLNDKVPLLLLHAAVVMKENDLGQDYTDATPLFDSLESHHLHDSQENLGFWGFADSGFVVKADKQGQRFVSMKGTRYGLCGRPLRKLLPFIESEMQIQINPLKEFGSVSPVWRRMHESRFNDSEKKFLCETFTHSSFSTLDRVRHGTGHSQEDVYLIRTGGLVRIPDAVIWPQCEEDVEKLVDMAKSLGWCLIPFGGGTNVTNATRCPTEDVETRPIISVDMKRMRKILWVNEEDGLAYVEAGITGRELVEELARDGLTMGHEPDSIEFSTLGGWIATKASGMKRSRYGNIEDIVKSVHVIGPNGLQWQGSEDGEITPGRAAEGLDLCSLVMGSEGCLGIITSAVIRIWPLPEVREYESVILQSFQEGLQFTRAVARLGANKPASVRLLDNAHFRLGQALRPKESTILGQLKKSLFLFTTFILGTHDPMSVVCATISYEGSSAEVKAQKKAMGDIAAAHGGMMLGSNIGKAGYDLTFMIAYLRDFAMTYHLLGESFETFVPWSKVETLIGATKARISQEHAIRLLPGLPFVGCRVTQLYHEGVCLYFYLCFSFDGVDNASEVFAELEKAARDEILDRGGSLSHHHGIGKLRAPLLKDRASPSYSDTIATIKKALDNDNIFGARNGTYSK